MLRIWIASLASLFVHAASAAPIALTYDSPHESKTVTAALTASTPIRIDGRLAGTGSIDDELIFKAGSSAMSLSAGWLVAPPTNRTVGVNIDLFDSLNNLVASDLFLGSDGTLASSRLAVTGLVAGASYRLQFTGTAVGFGRFEMDLVDGTVPPPTPTIAAGIPNVNAAIFDTHRATKTFPTTLAAGGTFAIDGKLQDDGGSAILDSFEFFTTSGTLSAGIEWIVGTLTDPQRTVGVNVDVFDRFNALVISDTFIGLTAGQAFSQFVVTGLIPGTYTLVFTGTTPNARGRYHIDLGTSTTAPGFAPIVDVAAVPEPGVLTLLVLGGFAFAVMRRRRIAPFTR